MFIVWPCNSSNVDFLSLTSNSSLIFWISLTGNNIVVVLLSLSSNSIITVSTSNSSIVLQCFDTVGWVIWPVKPVPDMTYNVFGGTLSLAQSQSQSEGCWPRITLDALIVVHSDTRAELRCSVWLWCSAWLWFRNIFTSRDIDTQWTECAAKAADSTQTLRKRMAFPLHQRRTTVASDWFSRSRKNGSRRR